MSILNYNLIGSSTSLRTAAELTANIEIHQKGGAVETGGKVIYMMSYTSLLYTTTPIHCTPLPLHSPVMNTQHTTYCTQHTITIHHISEDERRGHTKPGHMTNMCLVCFSSYAMKVSVATEKREHPAQGIERRYRGAV